MKTIVIRLGVWVVLIQISPTQRIWLVHIIKSRVRIIRIKWGRCEIWIHIKIERIIVVEFHFTNNHKQKRKSKQTNKKKDQNQAYIKVDLDLDDS